MTFRFIFLVPVIYETVKLTRYNPLFSDERSLEALCSFALYVDLGK